MPQTSRQYFPIDEGGVAGASSHLRPWMCWGEELVTQADAAISALIYSFAADLGRLPTQAEMLAGLLQGMPNGLPDFPDVPLSWAPPTDPTSPRGEIFQVVGPSASPSDVEQLLEFRELQRSLEEEDVVSLQEAFAALLNDAARRALAYRDDFLN